MSDIRVSVQWKSSVVFAGEDLECIITFKNVAQADHARKSPLTSSQIGGLGSGRERWKESLPRQDANRSVGHTRNNSFTNTGYSENTGVHGPPSTLTSLGGNRRNSSIKLNERHSTREKTKDSGHRRSVSIVSLGTELQHAQNAPKRDQASIPSNHIRGHARATSLQVLPWRSGARSNGPTSGIIIPFG